MYESIRFLDVSNFLSYDVILSSTPSPTRHDVPKGWLISKGCEGGGVFLLVYRLVESIYLLCLAVSRLKGV